MTRVNFEEVFDYIGGLGIFHILVYSVLAFAALFHGYQIVADEYLSFEQSHWCSVERLKHLPFQTQQLISLPEDNSTDTGYSQCLVFNLPWENFTEDDLLSWNRSDITSNATTTTCDSYVYNKTWFVSTMQTQWNLVCDNSNSILLSSTAYMAGVLLASLITGPIADNYGRQRPLCLGFGLTPVFGVLAAVMPTMGGYCFFRFMTGLSLHTAFLCSYVLIAEMTKPKYRPLATIGFHVIFSLGCCMTALLSYFVRDWFYLQLIIALPLIWTVPIYFLLPRSLRWELSQGYTNKTMKTLQSIGKINRKKIPGDLTLVAYSGRPIRPVSFKDLLTHKNLRKHLLIVYFIWFVESFIYYSLSAGIGNIVDDVFVNFFIINFVDVVGHLIALYTCTVYGRRRTLIVAFLISGLALFASIPLLLLSSDVDVRMIHSIFSLIGKAGAAVGYSVIFLYSVEMFPTGIRVTVVGTSSVLIDVSSIIFPYILGPLNEVWAALGAVIFGSFAMVVAAFCTFLLPNTIGIHMPDTIYEAEHISKKLRHGESLVNIVEYYEQHMQEEQVVNYGTLPDS